VREVVASSAKSPGVWFANVGAGWTDIDGFEAGAVAFVREAGVACRANTNAFTTSWRANRLLALPAVGTGAAGGRARTGAVLNRLLPALARAAAESKVDVALVCKDPDVYAAAQRAREQSCRPDWLDLLGQRGFDLAGELATHAQNGKLVLFLGAGASIGAGLPDWRALIEELGQERLNDDNRARFDRLSVLDQATLLERWYKSDATVPGRRPIADWIDKRFRTRWVSLVHQLLAALPVDEVVTTNYDKLFETASEAADRPVSVLPRAPKPGARRWLLKMHGCVDYPEDIVLTREDYLRYEQHRAALAGIVQALLITKHMMFIGFSLNDDNFHRIVDSVRRAVRPGPAQAGGTPFGTVLFVTDEPLVTQLWQGDLDAQSVRIADVDDAAADPPGLDGKDKGRVKLAARRLEVLLDCLGARTVLPSFLNSRFDDLLTERELRLRAALHDLVQEAPERTSADDRGTFDLVRDLAVRLGVRPGQMDTLLSSPVGTKE
jgi:hypothetical protein